MMMMARMARGGCSTKQTLGAARPLFQVTSKMPSLNWQHPSCMYVLQRQRRGGRGAVPGRREPPDRAHGKASTRSRPYPAPLGAPWSQGRAKQGCPPSTGGSAFASRSVPSSSLGLAGSRSSSLEQGTCRVASARSYMMVECYLLVVTLLAGVDSCWQPHAASSRYGLAAGYTRPCYYC